MIGGFLIANGINMNQWSIDGWWWKSRISSMPVRQHILEGMAVGFPWESTVPMAPMALPCDGHMRSQVFPQLLLEPEIQAFPGFCVVDVVGIRHAVKHVGLLK